MNDTTRSGWPEPVQYLEPVTEMLCALLTSSQPHRVLQGQALLGEPLDVAWRLLAGVQTAGSQAHPETSEDTYWDELLKQCVTWNADQRRATYTTPQESADEQQAETVDAVQRAVFLHGTDNEVLYWTWPRINSKLRHIPGHVADAMRCLPSDAVHELWSAWAPAPPASTGETRHGA